MKNKFSVLLGVLLLGMVATAQAEVKFFDDFENGLSAWTGQDEKDFYAKIVADPFNASNDVLSFSERKSFGDLFTEKLFSAGNYWITFDYLGFSLENVDSGGYFGVSSGFYTKSQGDQHDWLWATSSASQASNLLIDDGKWHHYSIPFSVGYDFHLMLEDFRAPGGNAYFDNIGLYNPHPPVPEPATMLLLGSGLLGMAGVGKKKFLRK